MSTQTQRNIIRVANPPLSDNQRTLLTSDVVAGGTSLTVLTKVGFMSNDRGGNYYLIIGNYGQQKSEIKLVTADNTDNKTLVVAALAGSHSASDAVTFLPYDKVNFYGMTSPTGTPTLLVSLNIDCSDQATTYVYTGVSYSYFCSAYYNTALDTISSYSDVIETTDFGRNSAKRIINSAVKKALTKIDESADSLLSWDTAISIINDGLDEIMARKRRWMFQHKTSTGTFTSSTLPYISIPTDLAYLENIKINGVSLDWISHASYDMYLYNGITIENGNPQMYTIKNNQYYLYPAPTGALSIIYDYYYYPTEVKELNDTVPIPWIAPLVFYCAAHFCYTRGNDKRGDKMYVMYQKILEQQVEEFSGADQLGNSEYVERKNSNYME